MTGGSAVSLPTGVLGDIADVLMGQSPVGSSYNRVRIGAPLINGPTEFTDRHPVPKQWTTAPVRFCKADDVLICVRGSSTGRMNIADQDYCIGRGVAAVRAKRGNDQTFVTYALSAVVSDLLKMQTGSTFPSIDSRVIKSGSLLVPSLREQERIGEALFDADDLIATLERLIAKKQAIKQGMMQQLLTGRTRLPGYSEDWARVTLGESGTLTGGGVDKTVNSSEESVKLLNYMDVYRLEFIDRQSASQVVTAPSAKVSKCSVKAGDVFFTPTSEVPDDIARSAVADDDLPGVVYSYHLLRWRPDPGWDRSYLAYIFSTEAFRLQAAKLAAGSGTRYVVSMPGFRSLAVLRPPLDEQRAIGVALRDVSSEISALVRHLAKARDLKHGMMQQLLAGRTRLTVEGVS